MAHLTALLSLCVACISAVFGTMEFSVSDCASNKNAEILAIPEARVTPHPIPIPGNIHLSGALRLNRNATTGLSLKLSIERYVGFFWVTVPCISDVGSCTYQDACTLLTDITSGGCPSQVTDTGLRCSCPLAQGTYTSRGMSIDIPELSGALSWLASGDYRVTAKLIDQHGAEVACQHLEGTIVDGHPSCSGFLCSIFG